MPTPTSSSAVVRVQLSGQRDVDALLSQTRWASGTLTYSFPDNGSSWSTHFSTGYGPSRGDGEPWQADFGPLSAPGQGDDQVYFARALQAWAHVADLDFVQVDDTSTVVGDIRAAYTSPEAGDVGTVAWAYYPGAAAIAGDVWFSSMQAAATERWSPGSFAYMSVLHELGHALGLKHPFENSADFTVLLPASLENRSYTLMSYSALPADEFSEFTFEPTTPMLLDVAAIQHLYGANTISNTGHDVYDFTDAETVHQTLWDAGGIDTLSYSGNLSASLDLRDGMGSFIGPPVFGVSSSGVVQQPVANVWIAYGVTIENAIGGTSSDTLTGNDATNRLAGGPGDDSLDGGSGIDTAVYSALRAECLVYATADGWTVQSAGADGTDQLRQIERLAFSDQQLALDLQATDHGGQALAFIGLMAPDLIASPQAVGVVLDLFDQGMSLLEVCQLALAVGFVENTAGLNTNAALAALAFENVMGFPADAAAVNDLTGYMDGRFASFSQAEFMEAVAMLDVNLQHINLVGLQQTGVIFFTA